MQRTSPHNDRWQHKFNAAQPINASANGAAPTPNELKAAAAGAESFNEVLKGGQHDNYIYTHKHKNTHKHKKDGRRYFATHAVSAGQSWRDKFKWVNYKRAHAETHELVKEKYTILTKDPRPEVAKAAQKVLDVLTSQKRGVVNTAELRQASAAFCAALEKPLAPSKDHVIVRRYNDDSLSEEESLPLAINASQQAPVVDPASSKNDRLPLPHVQIGTVNEREQTIISKHALSTLRDYVADLPTGSVLMQYGDGENGRVAYAGARYADDPVSAEERALNTELEQDFADTLKSLAEHYMDHESDDVWYAALRLFQLADDHLKAGTGIPVTDVLRDRLRVLSEAN